MADLSVHKKPKKAPWMAIFFVAGGCGCLALLGIIAAIFIPNFIDALAKGRQAKTMSDMERVSGALTNWQVDEESWQVPESMAELEAALAPTYIKELPTQDAWGTPYLYACWQGERGAPECSSFGLVSAGRDRVFERDHPRDYEPENFARADYDRDIALINQVYVQKPEKKR